MASSALITGGTGGLGAAVTQAFLASGWRVVVPVFVASERERLAAHASLVLEPADLFDEGSASAVTELAAGDAAAPLRAVVNLVGGFAAGGRVHETPVADFETQLRLNLRPAYLVCHAAIPHLLAAGGGAIVCVSSRVARQPFSGAAGYIVAKAAVLAFVDVLHAEYAGDGIRANAILPSVIDTPANRAGQPDADHSKWVQPAEIARVVRFLVSGDAAVTTGAAIPVYGRA